MFFIGDHLIPADAPIEQFQHATQIVLTLDNQRNSIRGETISNFRSESLAACLLLAGVKIFLHLQEHGCPPTTPVSDCRTAQGIGPASASNVISVIRAETCRVGAARLGFAPENFVTYSLCSSGAMYMHIVGVPDWTLMTIGWWRSLGFMVYI